MIVINIQELCIEDLFPITCHSEFPHIEVWFTDQNSKLLEIEDKINITLFIN